MAVDDATAPGPSTSKSIDFFERQFQQQPQGAALALNPFEALALPYLNGEVLDFGCGMGNLAFAAARRGCTVTAIDASPTAVEHIRRRARDDALPVSPVLADLRHYRIGQDYDAIVSIGLLMFFDCATAFAVLADLQRHVRPGGHAAVNVLIEGTTYLEMFDPEAHCLFAPTTLLERFAGWTIVHSEFRDFEAPGHTVKRFATIIAQRPAAA
jgi:tellurite methyltransferase